MIGDVINHGKKSRTGTPPSRHHYHATLRAREDPGGVARARPPAHRGVLEGR